MSANLLNRVGIDWRPNRWRGRRHRWPTREPLLIPICNNNDFLKDNNEGECRSLPMTDYYHCFC